MGQRDALELVELLLRGSAQRIFQLDRKLARLAKAPWKSLRQSVIEFACPTLVERESCRPMA